MILLLSSIFIFFNLFYVVALLKKDFSIIDIAWAPGFVLALLAGIFSSDTYHGFRTLLVLGLCSVWAVRLSGYILYRSIKTGKEDYRYAQWRNEWGERANFNAWLRVYMLQAILSLMISSPLFLLTRFPETSPFGTFSDVLGIFLWLTGFLFEALGDQQKNAFKSDSANMGRICRVGLWKYSRHPNYFGEALLWWGIFLIVINQVPIWYAIPGPLLLHFLLLKVSGVALLEKKYEGNAEFQQYKQSTNAFIPWFPRSH